MRHTFWRNTITGKTATSFQDGFTPSGPGWVATPEPDCAIPPPQKMYEPYYDGDKLSSIVGGGNPLGYGNPADAPASLKFKPEGPYPGPSGF